MKVCSVLRGSLLIAFSAALVLAQGQQQQPAPQPRTTNPSTPGASPAPGSAPAGVGLAVDPNKYSIGPEDVLYIQVWREPDFTRLVAVRPDGKITMPLLGDLAAGGLSPIQLTQQLTEKLGTYVNHPDVTVTVQEVRSKKYYIDGEAVRPGEYPLVTSTRILEAISKCGGFKEFADRKHVKILRDGKTYNFNYNEVTKGKHMEQNIELQNNDHIIVH